ncbi:MAG: response regulator [bacterium]
MTMQPPAPESPLILIADDENAMRLMLRHSLERDGYRITEAEDGDRALAAFEKQKPQLVLLDAVMPVLDGFATCARIRKLPGSENTPILIVTALDDEKSVETAFEVGANDYVTKPVHWAVLRQRVRRLVQASQVEEHLHDTEALMQAVVQHALDGIIIFDADGRIESFNRFAEKIFGYQRAEIIGESILTLFENLENREIFVPGSEREINGRRQNGTIFPMEYSVSQFTSHGKNYFAAILRDITERKQAAEAMQKAKETAEAATQAKSLFLANMSHEIRTPLNAVIGMNRLLLETELNPEQQEYSQAVQSSAEALACLLNDILDFSKIEAGKLELEMVDFKPLTIAENIIDMFAHKIDAKDLEFVVDIDPHLPAKLAGDSTRIRQILINLVGNAIKFTETGEIVVSCKLAEQEDLPPNICSLRYAIQDSGIGISSEQRKQIFESFSQADRSTTRKYGGTGLGLTLCKQLVEFMGGEIGVDSVLGKGSTFWFTVPLRIAEKNAESSAILHLGAPRALVIDDNASSRASMANMLGSYQVAVEQAESGAAALEILQYSGESRDRFDMILLDLTMPVMGGKETVRHIRQLQLQPAPKIILISSILKKLPLDELRRLGIDMHLTKPVKPSRLLQVLLSNPETTSLENSAPEVTVVPNHETEKKYQHARVLVVEDNKLNQRVAQHVLEKSGFEVDIAENGAKAVEQLERKSYQLVLMDVQMPVMNGLQATAAIREREKQAGGHVPIIAMTAAASEADKQRCLEAGMDGYLTKPVQPQKMFEELEKIMVEA